MNRFSNRIVRDLAWVIASPPLISGNYNDTHWWSHEDCLNEFGDCLASLIELDKNPTPLIEHIEKLKSKRLGLRFESFIAYWIIISPNFELVAQNIQIIEQFKKGNHTHGELDFIIKDIKTKKIIHLEVAVKFYLGTSPYEDPYRWFGTNTTDQLGKKTDHLKQHQTQLSESFTEHLRSLGYSIDIKHCILKGRLFYPQEINTEPKGITSNHLRGRWSQETTNYDKKLVCALDKLNWLSTLNHADLQNCRLGTGLTKMDKAQCYVLAKQNSIGIESSLEDDLGGILKEVERFFYLPENFTFPD